MPICDICGANKRSMEIHYNAKHPGKDWRSNTGSAVSTIAKASLKARPRTSVAIKKLFGFNIKEEYPVIKDRETMVLRGNPDYVFPDIPTQQLLMLLARKRNNHVYIMGPSGSGKTELVVNVADKLNWPLVRVNGDAHLTRKQLIGSQVVKGNEVVFSHNVVPEAMRKGWILLIDEYDTLNPIATNILKPVIERSPRLFISETNEVIDECHEDFRVVVTANTAGRGDETGMFVNTNTQSIADIRRFSGFIKVDFPSPDQEAKIILRRFSDEIDEDEAKDFCQVAAKMREAYKAGKLDRTFSPAEVLNWVETYTEINKAFEAAELSFLNAYPEDSRIAVSEMIKTVFGNGK